MKLVQPAVYMAEGSKENWIKLQDLLDIAKREFGIDPESVWSDLCEWQKPYGGFFWTTGENLMNSENLVKPEDFSTVYIQERAARHFYNMARAGVRSVRFNPEKEGHDMKWAGKKSA